MTLKLLVLAVPLLALPGCRSNRAWQDASLAPSVSFAEPVAPRSLVLLVLDAHSGESLRMARAILADARLAPAADSAGRIRITSLVPGRHSLRVVAIGYDESRIPIEVTDSTGLAIVVQLHRSAHPIQPVVAGVEPPRHLPNER